MARTPAESLMLGIAKFISRSKRADSSEEHEVILLTRDGRAIPLTDQPRKKIHDSD